MPKPTAKQIVDRASPRPWYYHNDGRRDWIEDAGGTVILENVGHLDGPLIVACVNEAHSCGTDEEALNENEMHSATDQREFDTPLRQALSIIGTFK